MIKVICYLLLVAVGTNVVDAQPASKKNTGKTKSGGKAGFYGSRFGSLYDAKDFAPDPPTTVLPEHLREVQLPAGVPGPHQQNIDDEIKIEVPNLEEYTARPTSDDLNLGIKGVKGHVTRPVYGVKGIKGRFEPYTDAPDLTRHSSTAAPETTPSIIRLTVVPNDGITLIPGSLISTTFPTVTENLVKKNSKGKGTKGGRKGYHYEVKNIKKLFAEDLTTASPAEVTTVEIYQPRSLNVVTTTESYQQETVAPIQQTEAPYQETEAPYQQTELPVQQTEPPTQQTELPTTTTELPIQQTELPVQDTEAPVQQTEEPVQLTESPVQQTELPTRETEPTTMRGTEAPTTFEPLQDTQSPEDIQVTQTPEVPIQTTLPPTTTEEYNDQQTELPVQVTEVVQVTELPVQVTELPTTTEDDFSKFRLGLEGRHQLKGALGGKTKGKGSKKGYVSAKTTSSPRTRARIPEILLLSSPRNRLRPGEPFVAIPAPRNRPRPTDPSVPLLPSLVNRRQ